MTDNRTTELLCKLLDERGVDYTRNDFGITWSYYTDPHTATESMDGTLIVTGLTPEQAIVATLGNGTLTAEQVREVIELNTHEKYRSDYDMMVEVVDWQAIADELNACAERMCEVQHIKSGALYDVWRCSACGYEYAESVSETGIVQNYCPNCGAKVVSE